MAHRLWHGIDVDVYIERMGIAVLGARLWATQFMVILQRLKGLLRPPQIGPQLQLVLQKQCCYEKFAMVDDGFASENLSPGGSARNFSDGPLFSESVVGNSQLQSGRWY